MFPLLAGKFRSFNKLGFSPANKEYIIKILSHETHSSKYVVSSELLALKATHLELCGLPSAEQLKFQDQHLIQILVERLF